MKLMLLHLSDIHLKGDGDPVLGRLTGVPDAVKNLDSEVQACLIVVTGDITYSGAEEQFLSAAGGLDRLRREIARALGVEKTVHLIVLPGNHDCDFSSSLQARERLIDAMSTSIPEQPDESIVAVCTDVQNAFFGTRDLLADGLAFKGNRLYWRYSLAVGQFKVEVGCCNTAWVSQLREQQGKLFFPLDVLPKARPDADLSILLAHHTYPWLSAVNGRAIRRTVESIADVVLTGHDHDAALRMNRGADEETNVYLEGGALQEADSGESSFNVVLFDLANRRQRLTVFKWEGGLFARGKVDRDWEPYDITKARDSRVFEPSEQMRRRLDDAGIVLQHPVAGDIKLGEVFVYPDFREVRYDQKPPGKSIRGEAFPTELRTHPHVIITGPDRCGKSTYAKSLFQQLRRLGIVPLLVDGEDLESRDVDKYLERLFREQYSPTHLEQFRQLDAAQRAVIVDDYDSLKARGKSGRAVLTQLSKHAGVLVLFGSDVPVHIADLVGAGAGSLREGRFRHFAIQAFGHVRRAELTEKWLALDPRSVDDPISLSRKVVEIKRIMDISIGRNYVPSFPIFLLSILQAHEHSQPVDITASTYGYFYELLIRQSLASVASQTDFDIWLHYLANIANVMFARGHVAVDERTLRDAHGRFEEEQLIKLGFVDIVSQLVKRQVLEVRDDLYAFKYPYIRYYFIASYLRDHIAHEETRQSISRLATELHREENANILLFLAHLSKDPFIVEQILAAGERAFPDAQAVDLSSPVLPTPMEVERLIGSIALIERPAGESRTELFERLDEVEATRGSGGGAHQSDPGAAAGDEFSPIAKYLASLGAAFKTMQILGQLLKNFPGSLEGGFKLRLARACRDLGLRILGSLVGLLQANQDSVAAEMVDRLRGDDRDVGSQELLKEVQATLFGLMHLMSYAVVRRVAVAVGSPHLGEVYDRILAESPSPFMTLVRGALRLDHGRGFPVEPIVAANDELAGNALGLIALKRMVVHHFYLFEEPISTKQQVCSKLGIPFHRAVTVEPRMKLLSPSKKGGE
jgi:predicted MPP superfamily phosphohydrolase